MNRLQDGKIIGGKRIIKFVGNLGKAELYITECVHCGNRRTLSRFVIERQRSQKCLKCYTQKVPAYSPKRIAQIKKDKGE